MPSSPGALLLRVIIGQPQAAPMKPLRREAGVCSMTTLIRRQTAITYEKDALLTSGHPHHRFLLGCLNWSSYAQYTNIEGTPLRPVDCIGLTRATGRYIRRIVLHPHSTPRMCWRSLGSPSRGIGTRLEKQL